MEVRLTPEQQAFMRRAVESGRYRDAEDAIHDALARWEADERLRAVTLAAIDEGAADLEAGRYRDYTDSTLSQLQDELKAEGRAFQAVGGHPRR